LDVRGVGERACQGGIPDRPLSSTPAGEEIEMLREIPKSELGDNWQEDRQKMEHETAQSRKALERLINQLGALLARLSAVPSRADERQQAAELYDVAVAHLTAITHEVLPVVT
jgi:hypothetical protein